MEKEPGFHQEQPRDRSTEIMEMRHRNAMTALKIEQMLSHEETIDEKTTTQAQEDRRIRERAKEELKPILDSLTEAGLMRNAEEAEEAIYAYIRKKRIAQGAENILRKKLEKDGKEATEIELGSEFFRQRTGENPKNKVGAVRQEGYFIISFFSDDDYLKFIEGLDRDLSGGLFHRSMKFPEIQVDVILNRDGNNKKIIAHERQHFINHSVLANFTGIENYSTSAKKIEYPLLTQAGDHPIEDHDSEIRVGLAAIKDEILARIRDGSDHNRATNFFDTDLYKYLHKNFSEDEQQEIRLLLKSIQTELQEVFKIFFDNRSQPLGILVYHLIDTPLPRFPERLRAIVKFYNAKIDGLMDLIPNKMIPDHVQDTKIKEKLHDLWTNITGEAYTAADIILRTNFGTLKITEEELAKKVKSFKTKIEEMRKEYDTLSGIQN